MRRVRDPGTCLLSVNLLSEIGTDPIKLSNHCLDLVCSQPALTDFKFSTAAQSLRRSACRQSFFISFDRLGILSWMTWPRRDVREAEFSEKRSHVALAIINAEPLSNDGLKINAPPTDHPVDFPVGAWFDDPGELGFLRCGKSRHRPTRPLIRQPIWPRRVEPVNPVAQGLAVHAADHGSLGTAHAVDNCCQRQQSPPLVDVLGFLAQPPKLTGRKIRPQSYR